MLFGLFTEIMKSNHDSYGLRSSAGAFYVNGILSLNFDRLLLFSDEILCRRESECRQKPMYVPRTLLDISLRTLCKPYFIKLWEYVDYHQNLPKIG